MDCGWYLSNKVLPYNSIENETQRKAELSPLYIPYPDMGPLATSTGVKYRRKTLYCWMCISDMSWVHFSFMYLTPRAWHISFLFLITCFGFYRKVFCKLIMQGTVFVRSLTKTRAVQQLSLICLQENLKGNQATWLLMAATLVFLERVGSIWLSISCQWA